MKPVGLIPEARPWWVIAREESQADSTPGAREGGKEGRGGEGKVGEGKMGRKRRGEKGKGRGKEGEERNFLMLFYPKALIKVYYYNRI